MAKLELIDRNRSFEDERSVVIKLTKKGKELEIKAAAIPDKMMDNLLSESVELEDVIQLKNQLNQLIEILNKKK
jgi:DNA-binding MarR family transcriptional regulator